MPQHSNHRSPRRWRQKECSEKTLEEIIVENFPKMGKEIATQVQESPKQDKPKVKHPKAHINQINEDQTLRTNIKSSKGKIKINPQGDPHKDNSWSFNRNSSSQKGMAGHTKLMNEKNLQSRLLYPARISFKYEGEIKSFTDKNSENSAPPNQLHNKC